jgi:hypothetical protein
MRSSIPTFGPALEKLVDPVTRGDPESPLRWTCKSTPVLAAELFAQHGIRISDKTVAKLLRQHGYSLQAPNEAAEGKQGASGKRVGLRRGCVSTQRRRDSATVGVCVTPTCTVSC